MHCALRLLVLAVIGFSAVTVRAEIFELANGGMLKGELLNPDDAPRKSYVIRLDDGAVVALASSQVARIAEKTAAELWYEEARKSVTADVDSHLKIAEQCKVRRLEAERLHHLEQALDMEPESAVVRRELGYAKLDGEWVKVDVWHRQRGYVKHKGKWLLPQEVAIEMAEQQQAEKFHQLNEEIRRWRDWVVKGRDRADEGLQRILAINDPAAAPVLAKLLDEKKEHPLLKRAYIEVLGRLPVATSSVALVKRSLNDQDARVREEAFDQLARRNDKIALRYYVQILKRASETNTQAEENLLVNAAAVGLAKLGDPSATLPLIEALVTKHKFLKGGGPGLNPVFGGGPNNGGGGLGVGRRQEIELREIANQNVRDALIALHPGINFGFDKVAWKRWYEQQRTPVLVDLRRERD